MPASGWGLPDTPEASRKTDPRHPSCDRGTGSLAILRTAGLDAGARPRHSAGGFTLPHIVALIVIGSPDNPTDDRPAAHPGELQGPLARIVKLLEAEAPMGLLTARWT